MLLYHQRRILSDTEGMVMVMMMMMIELQRRRSSRIEYWRAPSRQRIIIDVDVAVVAAAGTVISV